MKRLSLEDLGRLVESGKLDAVQHCPYCNKVSYPSEKDAKDGAREVVARGLGHSWSYECPKGNGWHLTSQPRNKSAKVPKKHRQSRSYRNKGRASNPLNFKAG